MRRASGGRRGGVQHRRRAGAGAACGFVGELDLLLRRQLLAELRLEDREEFFSICLIFPLHDLEYGQN